jgi:SPP1 family predicted phage head-tail adaptor
MILNGRVINPGELRVPILLAPRAVSTETGGFQQPAPDTANQVSAWARWINAHGNESIQAALQGAEAPAMVLTRYRADVDASWYISKDNGASWYELIGPPDDIQERHEYIELQVRRMVEG